MKVGTRTSSTGTSEALGGVVQTYTARPTKNQCAWVAGFEELDKPTISCESRT